MLQLLTCSIDRPMLFKVVYIEQRCIITSFDTSLINHVYVHGVILINFFTFCLFYLQMLMLLVRHSSAKVTSLLVYLPPTAMDQKPVYWTVCTLCML